VKRFDGIARVPAGALRDPVCTVGMFDGVHRGHRQLIYELEVWARAVEGNSCILTFDRHPLEVLKGVAVPLILDHESKLVEFERHGVDAVVTLAFAAVKDLPPDRFLRELRDRLGCRHFLLGFDSGIGRGRAGTAQTLPAIGAELGVEVRVASPVHDKDGLKIGSSAIRAAILEGDLERAANLLGRPFAVRGKVVPGAGRGRDLGAATANLDVAGQLLPPDGVYVVRVFHGSRTAPALANLGVRPTFGGGARTLEVHVPEWRGELYGETLEVRPIFFLRPERRFSGAAELKAQIDADRAALARAVAEGRVG